jgi:hypothetical protein
MADRICLGAYSTEQEALDAKALRLEPQAELSVMQDGYDGAHPWRIWWNRPDL